jgi:hypothetical protein
VESRLGQSRLIPTVLCLTPKLWQPGQFGNFLKNNTKTTPTWQEIVDFRSSSSPPLMRRIRRCSGTPGGLVNRSLRRVVFGWNRHREEQSDAAIQRTWAPYAPWIASSGT